MAKKKKFKIELAEMARDLVTGFKGIVVARAQYLSTNNRYGLQALDLKDGVPHEWAWFDEDALEIVPLNEDPAKN